ncbi:MAG: hypothetical protein ACT4ON_10460 [Bacteroidota bacterium]
MKKIAIIISLIIFYTTFSLHGQGFKTTAVDLKLEKNKTVTPRLRNTGIAFLCFGVATIVGGAVMVSAADGVTHYSNTTYNGVNTVEGSFSGAMGAFGIIGGSLSTIGGGLMTFFGQRKLNKSKRIQKAISFNLVPFSGNICYHF